MIIYTCQMLEGIKTDVLGLQTKLSEIDYNRSIKLGGIKQYRTHGTRMLVRIQTKILNIPARTMESLFNCIPLHIRNITGRSTEYFKKQLNEWLKEVPDQPNCGAFAERCVGQVTL